MGKQTTTIKTKGVLTKVKKSTPKKPAKGALNPAKRSAKK
jgi:hypothetical protein